MNVLKHLDKDIPASIVVFLVALPLCLGIALASNAPLFSGLISGIVGGIVVGGLSKSSVSVSGPAAGLTVIVVDAIDTLGTFEAFLLAVVIAGAIQFILGILKAGIIGHFFPSSVIKGMLSAIGLILILKQIPHAFGKDTDPEGDVEFMQLDDENTFTEIIAAASDPNFTALFICLASLGILLLFQQPFMKRIKLFNYIPGALIAVLGGVGLNELMGAINPSWKLVGEHLVELPINDSISGFIEEFKAPAFHFWTDLNVYTVAVTIAIVASLETLLSIEAADKIDPNKRITPPNVELRAQGVGNMISGMIGGLPVTAVIVRSSANIGAGAKTKLSAILHGVLLLVCAFSIPYLLNLIPLSCLAAVLLLVGYKLIKPDLIREMYRKGVNQFAPFLITIVAILFTDLLIGIGIGLISGLFFIIRSNLPHSISVTNRNNHYLIRFRKDASFMNKSDLVKVFSSIPPDAQVIIDAKRARFIDTDVLEMIEDFKINAATKNIDVKCEGF